VQPDAPAKFAETGMAEALSEQDAECLRTFEREGHGRFAEGYNDFFARITAIAIEPLLDAVHAAKGARLLDVATGPGALAAAAARRGTHAMGVDLAPGMIDLARRLRPGIEFHVADVEHLPFPDGSFDAVACSFGLGHFPRPEASVGECLRVLKPGGHLAFAWWDDSSRQRVQALFREAIAEIGATLPAEVPATHSSLRFCETAAFLNLLRGAGLADTTIAEHASIYVVPSIEALWKGGMSSLVLTGAAIRNQDAATQDRLRQAFERRARSYLKSDGLHVPIAFKIGAGRKPA
jgi:SAM-dependent methyltransferase